VPWRSSVAGHRRAFGDDTEYPGCYEYLDEAISGAGRLQRGGVVPPGLCSANARQQTETRARIVVIARAGPLRRAMTTLFLGLSPVLIRRYFRIDGTSQL